MIVFLYRGQRKWLYYLDIRRDKTCHSDFCVIRAIFHFKISNKVLLDSHVLTNFGLSFERYFASLSTKPQPLRSCDLIWEFLCNLIRKLALFVLFYFCYFLFSFFQSNEKPSFFTHRFFLFPSAICVHKTEACSQKYHFDRSSGFS